MTDQPKQRGKRVVINIDPKENRTHQEFSADADLNNIMAKYVTTGEPPRLNPAQPEYGYVPSQSFHEAKNTVIEAQNLFAELPSALRKRFGYSPENYLAFAMNPENRLEMAELGMLTDEAAAAAVAEAAAAAVTEAEPTPAEPPAEPAPEPSG